MDDVRGVVLSQLRPEGAGPGQGAGDLPLALVPLPVIVGEERCCFGIGGRGADEHTVDVFGPCIDGDVDVGEACQLLPGARLGEQRGDLGPVLHGEGFVVAGYGEVS